MKHHDSNVQNPRQEKLWVAGATGCVTSLQPPLRCTLVFRVEFSVFCNRIPWGREKLAYIPLVWFWHHGSASWPISWLFHPQEVVCYVFHLLLNLKSSTFWQSRDVGTIKLLKELPRRNAKSMHILHIMECSEGNCTNPDSYFVAAG